MIELKNIKKVYKTGGLSQTALDDVSLSLRDNEFVAILGPSGSGKTTLLNIIGGLDRYDNGDIVINGISTKNYHDRDWDSYRNHTIGFVFQSYNLIPHQTILSNVELALTISGVSKAERKQRALAALSEVGLAEQAHKRPNQLSGGQMQRVAIARALVNNPDILLADEPTGALDTKTSVQVMELLKKVASDRLVVMVTHNPELADEYANRIVRLTDGKITSDTNPYKAEASQEPPVQKNMGKARMGFFTALSLSFNNLLTKKGRTILTAFAGSIGIIGIALILSLSQGAQNYIDKIQEDTLTEYPLTITAETADMTSAILSMVPDRDVTPEPGTVRESRFLSKAFSSIGANDLKSFKSFIEANADEVAQNVTQIKYSYSVSPLIYTADATGKVVKINPSDMLSSVYSSSITSMASSYSMGGVFNELSNNPEEWSDQYELLKGRFPEKYDEAMLVLASENSISDLLVYSLGLRDTSELRTMLTNMMQGKENEVKGDPLVFTYDELMALEMRLIDPSDIYKYNATYDIYEDMASDTKYMESVYERSIPIKIVGLAVADGDGASLLRSGVMYTKELTDFVMQRASETEIVQKQLAHQDIDVFSGKRFDVENEENGEAEEIDFESMISFDEEAMKEAFKVNISKDDFLVDTIDEDEMQEIVMKAAKKYAEQIASGPSITTLTAAFTQINQFALMQYVSNYDTNAGTGIGLISLAGINTAAETITGDTYKQLLTMVIGVDANMSAMSGMMQMLTDSDFDALAGGLRAMFLDYYNTIKERKQLASLTSLLAYTKLSSSATSYRALYGLTISSDTLFAQEMTNETALASIAPIVSKIVEDYTTYMVAAAIGEGTGEVVAPITESLSGMGDAFGEDMFEVDKDKFAEAFKFDMDQDELARIMSTMMSKAEEKSLNGNLIELGYQDPDDPTMISFFFKDFEAKENFVAFLDKYNETVEEDKQITYTDITGLLMSSVKTIVDAISYVLIAFVSVSLVVSSIMIAVITLISVMERTKEIGILRAMGASKNNVASIFNAETFIIGLISGLIGVGFSYAAIPVINTILYELTDNADLKTVLPMKYALILVGVAVIMTVVAGIIPSRKASKNDPVVALRTE
ncbi:MAG: ABC transporter ATP-binding protein/permease [Lachnospiraceae bacterium]|nr:ABC transporter ATP-binding protein/permease [Candidatus Minthocola equi]